MFYWLDVLCWIDYEVQSLSLLRKSVLYFWCFCILFRFAADGIIIHPWWRYQADFFFFFYYLLTKQWCSSPSMGSLLNFPLVKSAHTLFADDTQYRSLYIYIYIIVVFQRTAGSSSDGTEDSDFSTDLEHTEVHEGSRTRSSSRLTRASLRLSQNSQGIW